jgi:hypothetical protein
VKKIELTYQIVRFSGLIGFPFIFQRTNHLKMCIKVWWVYENFKETMAIIGKNKAM